MATRTPPRKPASKRIAKASARAGGTEAAAAGSTSTEPVQRFTVQLERPEATDLSGTMTCFRVSPAHMAMFAPRTRVPVVITIKGFSWRTTIAPYGSEFYIGIRREIRERIKVSTGDTVDVAMQRDTAPRTVEVPADLARALKAGGVRDVFDAMAFSHRKEYVQSIEAAKRPETRSRRIEAAVRKVRAKRPLK